MWSRQERGVVERAEGIFWKGGVDFERLPYRCLKGEYILGGRVEFRECLTAAYIDA